MDLELRNSSLLFLVIATSEFLTIREVARVDMIRSMYRSDLDSQGYRNGDAQTDVG